jgi:hypothetical protein
MQKKLAGSFALQTQIVEPVQVGWTGSTIYIGMIPKVV